MPNADDASHDANHDADYDARHDARRDADHDTDHDPHAPEPAANGLVLPPEGVEDLTDQLTRYMTEIELGGLTDIMGQVLDDFLDQCGGLPEDLSDPAAFERITGGQLAVTLAYQLGRLEGRSPQIVNRLVQQAVEKWPARPTPASANISDADLTNPKELVYPRLRRLEYTPESANEPEE